MKRDLKADLELCEVGLETELVDINGQQLHTGDVVVVFTEDYIPTLGDKVRVRRIIELSQLSDYHAGHTERKWVSKEQELDGIVIGHRLVQEGIVHHWPDHIAFVPKKYIECYLVAYDLHRKPVHVLPEDMEVLSDE
jgi:hypothetical protein